VTTEQSFEVRVAQGPSGFTELFLAGVSLREIAYIFRSRFRNGYMIVRDVDTGSFLADDFAETFEAEGLLCDPLDEEGTAFLMRTDAFDLVADLKPFRLSLLFVGGPLTAEDYRLAGGEGELYPECVEALDKLGGRLFLYWRADHYLMLAGRDEWFPRDVLEYFFEKSFLDNERMLRPDEVDGLLRELLPTISDSGLLVAPSPEGDLESPVKAIGWVAPTRLGSGSSRFDGEVPCFTISRTSTGLQVAVAGKVRVQDFLGIPAWLLLWFESLRPTLGPVFVGLGFFALLQLVSPSAGGGDQGSSPLLEVALLTLLLVVLNPRR